MATWRRGRGVGSLLSKGLLVIAVAAACGRSGRGTREGTDPTQVVGANGVQVRFDPMLTPTAGDPATSWLAFPFPADHRRTARGNIKLADFPNPNGTALVSNYQAVGESEIDGFAANAAVHLAFDGPLDQSTIPGDPTAFMSAQSPVQLVDITAGSPEYGTRRPLRWESRAKHATYVTSNSFAFAPAWGFPLREKTTYALVMTSAVHDAKGDPLRAPALLTALLRGEATAPQATPGVPAALWSQLLGEYAPLRARLALDHVAPDAVVAATVFTVQSITAQLAAIHQQIAKGSAPALTDSWATPKFVGAPSLWARRSFQWSSSATIQYSVLQGSFASVNYQQGTVPYAYTGGGLNFVNGVPAPVRNESLRFVLSIPTAAPAGGCYPIAQVSHGTGGDAYSFVDDGTAGRLAARGMAAISIDQPLHGPRGQGQTFDVNLLSFNFLNAQSGRSTFRQGVVDMFMLTRFIRESLKVPANRSPTGSAICFDATTVGFFGHSQGGMEGAMAAAFERGMSTWMLSGAGGGMAVTVMERKDVMDIEALLASMLGIGAEEPLSELHPALTLIQTLTEVTDPLNYSPYWFKDSTYGGPQSVMMTSGAHDVETSYRTATALAVAGGLPLIAPGAMDSPEYAWAQLPTLGAPLSGDLLGGRTGGLLQFTNDVNIPNADSHFLVFYRPEAINASMRFLQSAAFEGGAKIERNPNADAR